MQTFEILVNFEMKWSYTFVTEILKILKLNNDNSNYKIYIKLIDCKY